MKRLLIICIASVLSANVPLDSTADSAISVDSHIDSTATADLRTDSSNALSPPQNRAAKSQVI